MAKSKRITTKSGKCKFGKVKSGPRKGRCRMRKLSGAAAKKTSGRKRRGAAFKGRKRNVVGKKAAGSGKFCLTKRTADGKSTTRCYKSQQGVHDAYMRLAAGRGKGARFRSIMMYSRKRPA